MAILTKLIPTHLPNYILQITTSHLYSTGKYIEIRYIISLLVGSTLYSPYYTEQRLTSYLMKSSLSWCLSVCTNSLNVDDLTDILTPWSLSMILNNNISSIIIWLVFTYHWLFWNNENQYIHNTGLVILYRTII